jgi:hypothetical protein
VLGPVAGGVECLDLELTQRKEPAVAERRMRVLGSGELVDVDGCARRSGEAAVTGNVIGVVMGLENVFDANPMEAAEP